MGSGDLGLSPAPVALHGNLAYLFGTISMSWMVSSPHSGQHHVRFYEFVDKLDATNMACLPFPPKPRQTKGWPGYIQSCRRGLFTTSNMNWILTCVREMLHEPTPERRLVDLVSLNKPCIEHLILSGSYLAWNNHTTKDTTRKCISCRKCGECCSAKWGWKYVLVKPYS